MSLSQERSKRRKPTLADLAERLGLDKSSVSLALRGSEKIGAATRAKVLAAAQQCGYRPNLAARQLATRQAQSVALVLPSTFAPLHFSAVAATVQSLAQQSAAAGLHFSVLSGDDLMKAVRGDLLLPLHPDGVLIWGDVPAHTVAIIQTMISAVVVLDPHDISYASYPGTTIGVDNAGGSRRITEHLISQGARRLLFVMESQGHLGQQQRWTSTRETWLKQHALDSLCFCHKTELTPQLLKSFVQKPDAAIFCSNDQCALDVWRRLQELAVRVPEQVLLAGFDAEVASTLIGLTSAVFDGESLGKAAFELLMRHLKGDAAPGDQEHVLIPVDISIGRTTQRPTTPPRIPPTRKRHIS